MVFRNEFSNLKIIQRWFKKFQFGGEGLQYDFKGAPPLPYILMTLVEGGYPNYTIR